MKTTITVYEGEVHLDGYVLIRGKYLVHHDTFASVDLFGKANFNTDEGLMCKYFTAHPKAAIVLDHETNDIDSVKLYSYLNGHREARIEKMDQLINEKPTEIFFNEKGEVK